MKKKIVFIAPHLSTGGMPQYLVKQIELIKDECEVYCVEWGDVTGGVLVVQRNKVVNLLGDRLITLGENKHQLFDVIDRIKPDVIHLQEIPELFMEQDVADKLYRTDRDYTLIETSHDSGYNPNTNKTYFPDKFLMVSQYQANLYKDIDVPCDVVEYPIENKTRTKTREQALKDLGLDPNLKHIINVGLFTPRKNQAEVIEYARMLQNYPIQFHFIGNQADNFKFYWEPLMKDFPSNCKWWNERSDVDSFYEAADLFLFTSRGGPTDHETMPLVIREALSWKTPSMFYNLPVYMNYFDKYSTIEYLKDDIQQNAYRIAEKLLRDTPQTKTMTNLTQVQTVNGEQIMFNGTPVAVKDTRVITIEPENNQLIKLESPVKEIYIISTYPNTDEKERLLNDTVTKFKKLGKDVLITSHYPVPEYIVEKADYYIYDSKNMLDTNRTLETNGPDYWMDDSQFRLESIIVNHVSSLSRTFSISMEFVKNLGYEYFVIIESDSEYDLDDLTYFDIIRDKTLQKNRRLFFCKPRHAEFNWFGSSVYETYCFGGMLEDFYEIYAFPRELDEWKKDIKDLGSVCIEYVLYKKFNQYESDYLILGTIKSWLRNSKVDLFSHSGPSGVYYNLKDEYLPVLFIYNNDEDDVEFKFNNGVWYRTMNVTKKTWYYEVLDLKHNDNLNIRIEKYVKGKLQSSTQEIISKKNIKERKKYRTILFNN